MPGEGAPGWVWWSDRAVRRTPASGAFLPLGRWAGRSPWRQVTEPTSHRAREHQESKPTAFTPRCFRAPPFASSLFVYNFDPILIALASHFRAAVDTPIKTPNWDLA